MERFTIYATKVALPHAEFPVLRITTALEWDDIVLNDLVHRQISELEGWLCQGRRVREKWTTGGGKGHGCQALFHGQPGTGKTLTAMLIGKSLGLDVYHVDLSTMESKYIGETMKTLDALFDRVDNIGSILYLDEADALFGKRSEVKDTHDRYANLEVSYILQKIEKYDGLVILSTKTLENIDTAFIRRLCFVIDFPVPDEDERRRIWQRVLLDQTGTERLAALLSRFELTGGNIRNAALFAAMNAADEGRSFIRLSDAVRGVECEVEKDGKVFQNFLEKEMAEEEDL